MKAMAAIAMLLALAACDAAQRAVQSATSGGAAAQCASSATYAAINRIILDRIGSVERFRTIDQVAKRVRFEQPVLDTVDGSSGASHCSADLVIPDALTFMIEHVDTPLHFRKSGDALITAIKYQIVRAADTGETLIKLDNDTEVGKFVYAFGWDYQSRVMREMAESEAAQARALAEDEAANAANGTDDGAKSGIQSEPVDARGNALDEDDR